MAHPSFASALLVLSLGLAAGPALAELRVHALDDGRVSVDTKGCSVLFDRHGEVEGRGRSCSDDDVSRAKEAFETRRREQQASGHDRGRHEHRDRRREEAEWVIRNAGRDGLTLRLKPKHASRPVARGIQNGTRVRYLGCRERDGQTWCRVEHGSDVGWVERGHLDRRDERHRDRDR